MKATDKWRFIMKKLLYSTLFVSILIIPAAFCALGNNDDNDNSGESDGERNPKRRRLNSVDEKNQEIREEKQQEEIINPEERALQDGAHFVADLRVKLAHIPAFLRLRESNQRADKDWQRLIATGQTIRTLQLFSDGTTENITDKLISAITTLCPHLERLGISWSDTITDASLLSIAECCHELRVLGIDNCKNITDKGMQKIVLGCQSINYLNLSECDITDATLHYIAQGSHEISTLIIQECHQITDNGLSYLAGCQNLGELDILGCENISQQAIDNLCQSLPELKIASDYDSDSDDEDEAYIADDETDEIS